MFASQFLSCIVLGLGHTYLSHSPCRIMLVDLGQSLFIGLSWSPFRNVRKGVHVFVCVCVCVCVCV